MPPRFLRPCPKCGALKKLGGRGLCDDCLRGYNEAKESGEKRRAKKAFLYGGDYRKKAATVRANATNCFMCGGVFKPGDPPQADHLYPELGSFSPLVPMHGGCNRAKGNQPHTGGTATT